MQKRFVTIWFHYLRTDWFIRRNSSLENKAFALSSLQHGRMIVTAVNAIAQKEGVEMGMAVADARTIIPSLEVLDDKPELASTLLKGIAEWAIRFTPLVAVDFPDTIILDVTGCAHLWGGEKEYLVEIDKRLQHFGYNVRMAMADTIGVAWAISRFGQHTTIIQSGRQREALLPLCPASLRIETDVADRLEKLGLRQIRNFIDIPSPTLRRRFGHELSQRLAQALGDGEEVMKPVQPLVPYQERLPCLEPIVTLKGIEIALARLLEALCKRLKKEQKGLRSALFKCYRADGKIEQVVIGTNRATSSGSHIYKLFEIKIETIEPASGIELFILEAPKVEDVSPIQEKLWDNRDGLDDIGLAELLDRLEGKLGTGNIYRYAPDNHYWPERSFKATSSLDEKMETEWQINKPRPLQLLTRPQPIEVAAPIPDYPPMHFRHEGKIHKITKADGPERIEQEWWLKEGQHRDYYCVEDEEGSRYWLFRSGHYDDAKKYKWFLHGFFP